MLKILIADDHLIIRQIVEENLRAMGFTDIDAVATSEEVQQKMSEKRYDIVFLDWYMPGKSGFALMKEYREERVYDDVAFVMVTAESQEKSIIGALKAGATSYIIKPIVKEAFEEKVNKVRQWLKNRELAKS